MSEIAIEFNSLGHCYQAGEWVFRNYSAQVRKGEIFSLLGPNGCGKTTLLKILLGALKPTTGSVQSKATVGFVPQIFQVTFDYSSLDMVLMGRAKKMGLFSTPSKADREAALAAMERFSIAHLADRPFYELSGGQRQLVVFARAMVSEAELLLLDEPTSALDLKNQEIILEWIRRLSHRDGLTVVFTTHHPHHALAVADTTLLMLDQDRFACGPAERILTEENLRALYGVEIRRVTMEREGQVDETLVPVFSHKKIEVFEN